MISFLSRLFIKNRDRVTDARVREAYGTLCSIVGIALNILLFAGKYFAGVISGSIAISADAFNNLSDAGSSLVTLLGFRLAGKQPDSEHPYGHGRMEYISGLVVSMFIILMGFELGKSSVEKIIHPVPLEVGWLPMAILLAAICVKLYMFLYNRAIGKKISSSAMFATATDSLSDCVATGVVLVSMLIARFWGVNIDAYAGAAVSLFILYSGINAAKDTLAPLLGQPPEPEFVKNITALVMAHPEIHGVHDLIVHDYGPGRAMVTLHAEVDGKSDIFHLHEVIDHIEFEIFRSFGCVATIHMDPVDTENKVISKLKDDVAALLKTIDERLTIHDFRVSPGKSHINLLFDAVIPYDFRLTDEETIKEIQLLVYENYPGYFAHVTIDHAE